MKTIKSMRGKDFYIENSIDKFFYGDTIIYIDYERGYTKQLCVTENVNHLIYSRNSCSYIRGKNLLTEKFYNNTDDFSFAVNTLLNNNDNAKRRAL